MRSVSEGMSVREECEGGRSVNEGMCERGVKWERVRVESRGGMGCN